MTCTEWNQLGMQSLDSSCWQHCKKKSPPLVWKWYFFVSLQGPASTLICTFKIKTRFKKMKWLTIFLASFAAPLFAHVHWLESEKKSRHLTGCCVCLSTDEMDKTLMYSFINWLSNSFMHLNVVICTYYLCDRLVDRSQHSEHHSSSGITDKMQKLCIEFKTTAVISQLSLACLRHFLHIEAYDQLTSSEWCSMVHSAWKHG